MRQCREAGYTEVSRKRSVPPLYSPSLVFFHGKNHRQQSFCTITDGCYHERSIPEMRQSMFIVDSSYGWLLMRKYHTSYLLSLSSLSIIHLPPLVDDTFYVGILTAPPSDVNCVVIFISRIRKSFIYCRIGDKDWIEKGLVSRDKKSQLDFFSIRCVTCKGKVYVFARPRVIVVIDIHNKFATELYEDKSPAFFIPEANRFTIDYVESCGEIFSVRQYHLGASHEVLTLDVFKLEFKTMDWVKVENLDDRIFLLGYTSSVSVSSSELQAKGNCLYFTCYGETYLNKFDMEDGTITTLPHPKQFNQWKGPFWVVPSRKLQVKNEIPKMDRTLINFNERVANGNDLMPELVELIMSNLVLADCIRLRLTRQSWMNITPPIRPYTLLEQSESRSDQLPWFLSMPKNKKGVCNFRHPIYSDAYIIEVPELEGAIIRHVKYGWWLMSQGEYIFFFNPTTKETIKLPLHNWGYQCWNISFSAPPTSSDYLVFGHCSSPMEALLMVTYRKGEERWKLLWIDTPSFTFLASQCSPVFCDGVFYCLGKDGKLGVFDPNEADEDNMWRLQPKAIVPEAVSPSVEMLSLTAYRSFLMEYEGEIISVFVGTWGKPVSVFKLNRSEMKWDRVQSLGNRVIFVSHAASILMPASLKGIENRIYFPRYQGKDNLFYSLSSNSYHCFGGKGSRPDWLGSSRNWNCAWIQSSGNGKLNLLADAYKEELTKTEDR